MEDLEKDLEKLESTKEYLLEIKKIWGKKYTGTFDLLGEIDDILLEIQFDIDYKEEKENDKYYTEYKPSHDEVIEKYEKKYWVYQNCL